jgi:hypothetical protein
MLANRNLESVEASSAAATLAADNPPAEWTVPLLLDSPCASATVQPVTVGLPFPAGALADPDGVTLLDAAGTPVAVQAQALARWSDGSVKWLLLDFLASALPVGQSAWTVVPRVGEETNGEAGSLVVREGQDSCIIDTGAATFHLDRGVLRPFRRVLVEGQDVVVPGSARCLLTDPAGRAALAHVDRLAVEARGPVRATVRLEGTWEGRVPCRFTARLSFYAGTGWTRFRLTLHNPNRARHGGGLWDLGDTGSMFFRDLSLELDLAGGEAPDIRWVAEAGQPWQTAETRDLEIYQDSSGGEHWQSRTHVNREGRVPCSFRGYRVQCGRRRLSGLRASPAIVMDGKAGQVAVAIPEFWQQFPKALEAHGRLLRARLFPAQFDDQFELQGGEQKTHTIWLHFGAPGTADSALDWVHQPALVRAAPEWYAGSEAIPHLEPAGGEADARLGPYLREVLEGPTSLGKGLETIDEYGWRNFGDIYAEHEGAYYSGPAPVISHYNNQYDLLYGALLQYLRTGDGRWYELADPLARHVADIDIYHTDQDRAGYNGGLFWFTDHYKDAATSTHRTYSRHNCPAKEGAYGGGPSSNHNFTTGLLHYHYLTGDPDARAAVLSLADWVVNMDDGTKTPLAMLDDGPTGLASYTGTEDYQGPGRGSGNSVNALLDAWLLTGRQAYLDRADELIRRTIHPADDVAARNFLDVEKYWSYPVLLVALARYLHLKAEAGALDAMYAYAQASLLRYAGWMLEHERPYFDKPEQLEYPTETWAAQEFRKANVLRLAAAHASEPLRGRLLRRGQELADRAWSDLLRFESRATARAAALVMVDGPVDSAFRARSFPPAPPPAVVPDFGKPTVFLPQKLRVRAQLLSLPGLARALLCLANPRHWPRYAQLSK